MTTPPPRPVDCHPAAARSDQAALACIGSAKSTRVFGPLYKQGPRFAHLAVGAKKVLLSTTGSPEIPLMIYGFNQQLLTPETDTTSPGGCMTNCSTHILYLLNSIGIESAHTTVLHSYTSRQGIVDAQHKQFRREGGAESITTRRNRPGPFFGKIYSRYHRTGLPRVSTRVPVANGALADFTIQLKHQTTVSEINKLFRTAAANEYKGIIDYTGRATGILRYHKGNTHSALQMARLLSGRHSCKAHHLVMITSLAIPAACSTGFHARRVVRREVWVVLIMWGRPALDN